MSVSRIVHIHESVQFVVVDVEEVWDDFMLACPPVQNCQLNLITT